MTDRFRFADPDPVAIPVHVIPEDRLDDALAGLAPAARAWADLNGFTGGLGQHLRLPDEQGALAAVLAGYGSAVSRARGRFHLAGIAADLPDGTYRLDGLTDAAALSEESLGWLLASYRFTRYRDRPLPGARLVAPDGIDAAMLERIATGEALTRDLINTPAEDMGPADLELAAGDLARTHGAKIAVTLGDDLLAANFPLIHAVGRASPRAPRLIDLSWGDAGPRLTLVGKGVCFDTGGLNLKPGSTMGLMKKDMGGAANVLGLAYMIMAARLPIRLRVLIPAVENAVAGDAFRPGDILTARDGKTVEINNTDAEGRLVLADALALASEDAPDLLISVATLTGAARVALGPDLAPFFANDDALAGFLADRGRAVADPLWRLPFHAPYETMIEPGIADLDNAPAGGLAGAITAALFLRRFVTDPDRYVHFDIYGWQPSAAPARPKGGVGQGIRALFDALPSVLQV